MIRTSPLVALTFVLNLAHAGAAPMPCSPASTPDAELTAAVRSDSSLETKIKEVLIQAMSQPGAPISLKDFSVQWGSLRCLAVVPSELSEGHGGVCTVEATAFQVISEIAITASNDDHSVKVIYADIE